MTLTRFHVGLGPNSEGSELTTAQKQSALESARTYLIRVYGGYTEYETRGGFKDPNTLDPDAPPIFEDSIVFEVVTHTTGADATVAEHLCTLFNQTTILYHSAEVQAGLARIPSPITIRPYTGAGDDNTSPEEVDMPF